MADPVSPDRLGPAVHAARRERESRADARPRARAFGAPDGADDPDGQATVLAATRALLLAETRRDVTRILADAIHDLGGAIVPARLAAGSALPVDVSLGAGEPRVVAVDPMSPAASRLATQLPTLVEDALVAAARCDVLDRERRRASVDALTGVATRTEIGPRLGTAREGDVVCVLDLDGFKALNDTAGHAAGDDALRAFGELLRASMRESDFCGRYGGDEFIVLTPAPLATVHDRMCVLAGEWARLPGHGTTVSVGVAVVGRDGAPAAVDAADRAMYRAKRGGAPRVVIDDGSAP
ncbi:MAG TPA: GGDEF domain-containing protein [Mycobacteriales bacterium]|jgi:diguanylate cyclase (GGDEF)-like protein|nr:GGDEF domain-containing protein [Mycobacteriales bacterium]